MWRLWDTHSQQEQEHWYRDNKSSDGIPVLATESEENVILLQQSQHHL